MCCVCVCVCVCKNACVCEQDPEDRPIFDDLTKLASVGYEKLHPEFVPDQRAALLLKKNKQKRRRLLEEMARRKRREEVSMAESSTSASSANERWAWVPQGSAGSSSGLALSDIPI